MASSSSSPSNTQPTTPTPTPSAASAFIKDPNYDFCFATIFEHRKRLEDLEYRRRNEHTPGTDVATMILAANAITDRIEYLKRKLWEEWFDMMERNMAVLAIRCQCPTCFEGPFKRDSCVNHNGRDEATLTVGLKLVRILAVVDEETIRTVDETALDYISYYFGVAERELVKKLTLECEEIMAKWHRTGKWAEDKGAEDDGTKDVKRGEDHQGNDGTEDSRTGQGHKEDNKEEEDVSDEAGEGYGIMSALWNLIGMGGDSSY